MKMLPVNGHGCDRLFFFWKVQVSRVSLKDGLMEQAGVQPRRSLERGNVQSWHRC